MHRSALLTLAALPLLLTACRGAAITTAPTATATAAGTAACGPVSTLEPNASMGGYALAHAGPLWFSAFGRVRSGPAVIGDFAPGGPTKVVIRPDPSLQGPVELRGAACADGTLLHFCYLQGSCGFTGQPVSPAVLAQRGQAVLTVAPGGGDDTGYMLFPRAGKYRLVVTAGARVVGEVVLLIQAGALPTATNAPPVAAAAHPATTTGSVAAAIATATGE